MLDYILAASVKKSENIPLDIEPYYLSNGINNGPLFDDGETNYLPSPINP